MPKDSLSLPPTLRASSARPRVALTAPLRHARYRHLWIANLVSNLGTWTQTFASAWLIASLSTSSAAASLVQTASYLPIFLFALPAGVLADAVDRPRFLFFCNLFMAACAACMALLVLTGHAAPTALLALTFCMGSGAAFMWPAWQASMCALMEPSDVESAATLNNLSYNVAAIVGPALGGLLFKWVGPGALFLVNAVSFAGLLSVYWAWWREGGPAGAAPLAFRASLACGMRTALGCPRYRRILANVCTVFFATIAFASLLPVFVRDVLRMDSGVFGLLMGSLGGGAVLGACVLPTLRARIGKTALLACALLVYGAMLILMPMLHTLALLVPLIVAGGMAWSATVSTMNAAAQLSFPPHIRARTLSIYLFVMAAGYTLGSLAWGWVADRIGVSATLGLAGACVMGNAVMLAYGNRENPI
ncbi:MAG: MFS transporter [Gammaproteobacteria bacterium]